MVTNTTISHRTGVSNVSYTDHNNHNDKRVEGEEEKSEQIRSKSIFCTGFKGEIRSKAESAEVSRKKAVSYLRKTIMSEHIETRKKLKGIADISSFTSLINQATLSDTDKSILFLHYIDEKDFRYIGDMLGYSESTIKKRHKRILAKLSKLL